MTKRTGGIQGRKTRYVVVVAHDDGRETVCFDGLARIRTAQKAGVRFCKEHGGKKFWVILDGKRVSEAELLDHSNGLRKVIRFRWTLGYWDVIID